MLMKAVMAQEFYDPDDEELIARITAGDEAAFRVLAERYGNLLYSIAYRMRFSKAGAEDVVQEAMMRIWQHAGKWDKAKGASVKTWICRIASNLCIDDLRKQGRETGDMPEDRADDAAGPHDALEEKQTGAMVGRQLQALPRRQRMALVLFHYEGLSVVEVAQALGTSHKGAESLLTRARVALRQRLEKYEGAGR